MPGRKPKRVALDELRHTIGVNVRASDLRRILRYARENSAINGRDYIVLEMALGLPMTREEAARRWGVTASRVGEIEYRAIDKMTRYLHGTSINAETDISYLPWRDSYGDAGLTAAARLCKLLNSRNEPLNVGGVQELFADARQKGYLLEDGDRGYGPKYLGMTYDVFKDAGFVLPEVALRKEKAARK
ncbi:MAG: hypothetical protein HY365_02215 [Candidatus Aenigmarchaeota archaeon]|nr:hypothetical protein [Candidatus Aenigmarchaeota archaeon]